MSSPRAVSEQIICNMFFFKLLTVYELFCICTNSRLLAFGKQHRITLKKTKPLQNENIVHGVNIREIEDESPAASGDNSVTNTTATKKVKEENGSRRYLGFDPNFAEYQQHPIIHGPLFNHHVHFVPKPYPVVSVQYVPKPFPVPYAVPSHVHVSHLHLRPKCKYERTC